MASLEATKSVFDLTAPIAGEVLEVCAKPGDSVPVGQPIAKIKLSQPTTRRKQVLQENPGKPLLTRSNSTHTVSLPARTGKASRDGGGTGGHRHDGRPSTRQQRGASGIAS